MVKQLSDFFGGIKNIFSMEKGNLLFFVCFYATVLSFPIFHWWETESMIISWRRKEVLFLRLFYFLVEKQCEEERTERRNSSYAFWPPRLESLWVSPMEEASHPTQTGTEQNNSQNTETLMHFNCVLDYLWALLSWLCIFWHFPG